MSHEIQFGELKRRCDHDELKYSRRLACRFDVLTQSRLFDIGRDKMPLVGLVILEV